MGEWDDIIKECLVESGENLDQLDRDFIELEKNPTSKELLSHIFRAIHTVKGTSGVLGFPKLESVAHIGENLLSMLRDGEMRLDPELTSGRWEGAVRLDSSLALARMAAARFVGSEPDQVSIDQIRDAMGELANMSAGMIKNLLPAPSYLSLPLVADGSEYNFMICKSNVESEARFDCEGERLAVSLLHRKYSGS